jgi:hypothetical protein
MRTAFRNLIASAWIALLPVSLPPQALPDNPEPAPSGRTDWTRVQDLANGQGITVARTGALSVPCRFTGATKDDLFCESPLTGREYRFRRADVERVRMDNRRENLHILIGAFAAAGFVWGVASPPGSGGASVRVLAGIERAGIVGVRGLAVAIPAAFLIPGRLIYRPRGTNRNAGSSALPQEQGPAEPASVEPAH